MVRRRRFTSLTPTATINLLRDIVSKRSQIPGPCCCCETPDRRFLPHFPGEVILEQIRAKRHTPTRRRKTTTLKPECEGHQVLINQSKQAVLLLLLSPLRPTTLNFRLYSCLFLSGFINPKDAKMAEKELTRDLTKEEIAEFKEAFEMFDIDGNGKTN